MIKIFENDNQYIDFLTSLSIEDGEVFCVNFLPSSFFPKHSLRTFFENKNYLQNSKRAISRLWKYGKSVRKSIEQGRATLCVEISALNMFCDKGLVHEAVPSFEVGFPVRADVLNKISRACIGKTIYFVTGPIPFIFRLHPPNGILIDVRANKNDQLIQGIWIEDDNSFNSFQKEQKRLIATAPKDGRLPLLQNKLFEAIESFEAGYSYTWSEQM